MAIYDRDGVSRTVLDVEDSSRTKNRGLGLGLDLECQWPWPWPRSLVLDDLAPVTFNQHTQVKIGLTLHYNVILISTMLL